MIYPILVPSVMISSSPGVAVAAARPKPAGNSQRWRRKGGRNVRTLGQPKWTVVWSKMWEIPWIMALSMNFSNFSTMECGGYLYNYRDKGAWTAVAFCEFQCTSALKYNVTGVFTCIHFFLLWLWLLQAKVAKHVVLPCFTTTRC